MPFPPPGDPPDAGIEPTSLAWAGGVFTNEPREASATDGRAFSSSEPRFLRYEMETEASASWDGFGERKSALAQHMVWLCFGIAIPLRSEEIQR